MKLPPAALTVYALGGLEALDVYAEETDLPCEVYDCPKCDGEGAPIDSASGRLLSGTCGCCNGHGLLSWDGLGAFQVRVTRESHARREKLLTKR